MSNEQSQVPARMNGGPIVVSESGLLVPKTATEMIQMAEYYLRSGLLPKRFDSAPMIVTAMQYAIELGLKPLTSLRQIGVVNGVPCTFGDLPLSMTYGSGKLEWIDEKIFDKDGKEISPLNGNLKAAADYSVCILKRKGDPKEAIRSFSMDEAKIAELLRNPTWLKYPKIMLKYRARSQALKDKFPDVLNGVAIAEYDYNIHPADESPAMHVDMRAKPMQVAHDPEKIIANQVTEPGDVVPMPHETRMIFMKEFNLALADATKRGLDPKEMFGEKISIASFTTDELKMAINELKEWKP